MSLDGHDKLCGYQKSMFPLCIYGGQDAFSGRINFLKIWTTNNDPKVIGKFYFDYLYESRGKAVCNVSIFINYAASKVHVNIVMWLFKTLMGKVFSLTSEIFWCSTEQI